MPTDDQTMNPTTPPTVPGATTTTPQPAASTPDPTTQPATTPQPAASSEDPIAFPNQQPTPSNTPGASTPDPSILTPNQPSTDAGNGSAPPADGGSDDSTVVTSTHVPEKYGGKKVIATIFSVLFIVGAVVAGVTLVQRQQLIEQQASSGSECQHAHDCILLDSPGNSGSFDAPQTIKYVDITDKDSHRYNPGQSDDGCRKVNISGRSLTWQKYGSGPSCKDVSNVQVWLGEEPTSIPSPNPTATPTPAGTSTATPTQVPGTTATPTPANTTTPTPGVSGISAQCNEVVVYDLQGNTLSQSDLSSLKAGDKVTFAVSGQTDSGTFTKARFTVNGTLLGETTTKNSKGEYVTEYTIPANTTTFKVKGEVYHSSLGWI